MTEYQRMYAVLFNAVTDALEYMQCNDPAKAREILIQAQQKAEEIYMAVQDKPPE